MRWASAVLVCLLCSVCAAEAHADVAKNDAEVSRLRGELRSHGAATPPDPPKELGVHTACVKHGRSCPDEYVAFLAEHLKTVRNSTGAKRRGTAEAKRRPASGTKNPRNAAQGPKETNADRDLETQLENMRHLRNVLRDRLVEQGSPESVARCEEARWLQVALRVVLTIYNHIVHPYWSFVMYRLLLCSVLTALVTWILFGDRIPREHLRCLLSRDPTFLLSELGKGRRRSLSVAELVMERESFNMSGSSAEVLAASCASTQDMEREVHRRNRWAVTRFTLLEAHNEARATLIVAKLRLVLSAAVFALLLWTLFALPIRVADLRGGERGVAQRIMSMFLPSWLGASLALYVGWSWVGGMVAYAGWEALAAVDALMRTDERAAALHELILQRWDS